MFGLGANLTELAALNEAVGALTAKLDIVICPPATLLTRAAMAMSAMPFCLGGQDCHQSLEGAHTGDVSAAMLVDAGAKWVILGHSERRKDHGETDELVQAKLAAATQAGLTAVVCVGETAEERKAGLAEAVVGAQLAGSLSGTAPAGLVIAYEPVWAIGTGLTATPADIAAMHGFVRAALAKHYGAAADPIRVLYGGSVKPSNAGDIFATPDVDGALVGGASLKAADFGAIVRAHPIVKT